LIAITGALDVGALVGVSLATHSLLWGLVGVLVVTVALSLLFLTVTVVTEGRSGLQQTGRLFSATYGETIRLLTGRRDNK